MRGSKEVDFKNIRQPKSAGASSSSNPSLTRVKVDETLKRRRLSSPSARLFHLLLERCDTSPPSFLCSFSVSRDKVVSVCIVANRDRITRLLINFDISRVCIIAENLLVISM